MRSIAAAALCLLLALGAAGCGAKTIDRGGAERFLHGAIKPAPRSVHCPANVKVRAGASFGCRVLSASGAAYTVTLHVVDRSGRVRVSPADIRPG